MLIIMKEAVGWEEQWEIPDLLLNFAVTLEMP